MNNEAFSSLVKERTKQKSTKEIAREAVEDELKRRQAKKRKRGRRGDDGGSSSDEDDDNHKSAKNNAEKYYRQKIRNDKDEKQQDEDNKNINKKQYRDRAKERREGKSTTTMIESKSEGKEEQQEEDDDDDRGESDFDPLEQHYNKKGLDFELARRIKREMTRQESHVDDDADENDWNELLQNVPKNKDEAVAFISQKHIINNSDSPLANNVLKYLRQTFLSSTPCAPNDEQQQSFGSAGLAIQQSSLLFSLHGHPGDLARAWEMPQEEITTSSTRHSSSSSSLYLPSNILQQIGQAFAGPKQTIPTSATINNNNKISAEKHDGNDMKNNSDSDEDIFADAGEYIPSKEISLHGEQKEQNLELFSSSLPETSKEDTVKATLDLVAKLANKRKTDRAAEGQPMSFEGDYGQDMDIDSDQDDGNDTKRKKKGKTTDLTTRGAVEYGKRNKTSAPSP